MSKCVHPFHPDPHEPTDSCYRVVGKVEQDRLEAENDRLWAALTSEREKVARLETRAEKAESALAEMTRELERLRPVRDAHEAVKELGLSAPVEQALNGIASELTAELAETKEKLRRLEEWVPVARESLTSAQWALTPGIGREPKMSSDLKSAEKAVDKALESCPGLKR